MFFQWSKVAGLALIGLVLWASTSFGEKAGQPIDALEALAKEEGASVKQLVLRHGSELPMAMTVEEVEAFQQKLGDTFDIPLKKNKVLRSYEGNRETAQGLWKMKVSTHPASMDLYHVLITIDWAQSSGDLTTAHEAYKQLTEHLQQSNISPNISTSIQAWLNDTLNVDQQNELMQKLLKKAKAKKVEGVTLEQVISISAYTSQWNDAIESRGQQVNLQMGLHNDTLTHKTVLTLGTPIITMEY